MKIITILSILFTSVFYSQNNKINTYKYGFINIITGKEITSLKYDEVKEFNKEFASVRIDDKWGAINCTGKEVVELKFQYIGESIELNKTVLLPVIIDNKWVIFDKNGYLITTMKFDNIKKLSVNDNSFGLAVKLKDKWGVIDHTGQLKIPIRYKYIADIETKASNKYLSAGINKKRGVIDTENNKFIPIEYNIINQDNIKKINDLKSDTLNEKKNYDYCFPGYVKKGKNKRLYYRVNRDVYMNYYILCSDTLEYYIPRQIDNKYILTTLKNTNELETKYDSCELHFERKYSKNKEEMNIIGYKVRINNKWGIISVCGKEITPLKYDYISTFKEGFTIVGNLIE